MRFAITARALVRSREREEAGAGSGSGMTEILAANVRKVTRFREDGEEVLEREVRRLEGGRKGEVMGPRAEGRERRDEEEGEYEERDEEDRAYKERQGDIVERTPQGNDLMRRRR
jgi:hypothetical protein